MSKRSWVVLGVAGLIITAMLIPAAAGGTGGASKARGASEVRPASASLRSSNFPVRCAPGANYGSVSVPVGVGGPQAGRDKARGMNALVGWTIDGTSAGSNKRFVPYNTRVRFTSSRVPCTSPRPRVVCRLVFKRHPPSLRLVCHRVDPAS
jgi:hypothetical protein